MKGPGIDYSNGKSNIDHATGIHYGVINQHEVLQAWADSSEANYGQPENTECDLCGTEFSLEEEDQERGWGVTVLCPKCCNEFEVDLPDCAEPLGYYFDSEEYIAECGDDGDIFVMKSPYFTYCVFCSPCAPGAGYLMTPADDGIKAYCFGHDWFDDQKAPYKVYSVKTGEEVQPWKD